MSQSLWRPVIWQGISETGVAVENRVEIRFRRRVGDGAIELTKLALARLERLVGGTPDFAALEKTSVVLGRVLLMLADGWRGVLAEDGRPLPWSTENVDALMNIAGVFEAVAAAHRQFRREMCERGTPIAVVRP